MTRYFLCKITGKGITDDEFRPSLIEWQILQKEVIEKRRDEEGNIKEITVIKDFIEYKYPYKEWSAIYYPNEPPYEYCLIRIEFENDAILLDEKDYIKEIVSNEDWEKITQYQFFKERWLDANSDKILQG